MLRNTKGLTLFELLAALTITTIVVGAISMLIHFSNSNSQNLATRESILKESRAILNVIADTSKSKLVIASRDIANSYVIKLDEYEYGLVGDVRKYKLTGNYVYFHHDLATKTVTIERRTNGVTTTQPLSTHVSSFVANLTADSKTKVELIVTVDLPNQTQHQSSTSLYIPTPNPIDLVTSFD